MAEGPKRSRAASGQLDAPSGFSSSSISSAGEMITFFFSGTDSGTEKLGRLKLPSSLAAAAFLAAFGREPRFFWRGGAVGSISGSTAAAGVSSAGGGAAASSARTGEVDTTTKRPRAAAREAAKPMPARCTGASAAPGPELNGWYWAAPAELPRNLLEVGTPVETNAAVPSTHAAAARARAACPAARVLLERAMAQSARGQPNVSGARGRLA
mmetsp:Transcript_22362/g.67165  ORF Transcript_22362/g.67165 Transcript_22362/m.67165 type:complete len:212 (-) Transcript_22362:14-649(-)